MRQKKIFIFIFIACILLYVTGCDTQNPDCNSPKPISPSTPDITELDIARDEFIIENAGCELNAVHTYINDGNQYPTVLLIAGSGPSDCDATFGENKPFADIANALAEKKICSLRLDKRTLNYGTAFANGGIEEEYLADCRVAISYLKEHSSTSEIYLLGHSLGGQIACVLEYETEDISGIILLNSSLRHLADIACDQYSQADEANKKYYRYYADMAKAATLKSATGLYFYGATDYYWSSYNQYHFKDLLKGASSPVLIINSTSDRQIFKADIALWEDTLGELPTADFIVDSAINHFGYHAASDSVNFPAEKPVFSEKIIDAIVSFINDASI